MKKLSVKTVVAIGIGAALFFVLARFVAIPSGVPNTNISLQYAVLSLFTALFGPIAGALIGLIGHALSDATSYGLWWSWIIASGFAGAISGLLMKGIDLKNGVFGKKEIIRFCIANAVAHLISWVGVAATLDILIYSEDPSLVFTQGLVAAAANIVTTLVVGTLLCIAYSKTVAKKGSLDKE